MGKAFIVCVRSVGSSQEPGSRALTPVKFELSLATPAVVTGDGILVHRDNVQAQAADLPNRGQSVHRPRIHLSTPTARPPIAPPIRPALAGSGYQPFLVRHPVSPVEPFYNIGCFAVVLCAWPQSCSEPTIVSSKPNNNRPDTGQRRRHCRQAQVTHADDRALFDNRRADFVTTSIFSLLDCVINVASTAIVPLAVYN